MACADIVADQVPTSRSAGQNYAKTSLTSKTATSPHDCPGREPQNERAGRRADTGCTPDSAANVKARAPPERAPEPPSSGYPHRSLAPFPSAMRPWTPQHRGLQRNKVTHDGTEQKPPASTRIRS
jgi:hypothetical protein